MNAEERRALEEAVIASCGAPAGGWHPTAWAGLGEIGATLLAVPADVGGGGADLHAATVALMALGSVGASVPAVETGLMAGWLLEMVGGRLRPGVTTAAAAGELELTENDGRVVVSGRIPRVPWARHADHLVALSTQGGRTHVLQLPLRLAGIEPGLNLAGEPRDDVVLAAVAVPTTDVYRADDGGSLRCEFMLRGAFGRAAMMAGAAQGVYAYAADFARVRHQFGRPLAAMQAVQQQLAQLAGEASAMTVAVEAAALAFESDRSQSWPLAAARVRVASSAANVAAIGHQILGAIGVTDEHPLHRLTTRLWAWREENGNQAAWADHLGSIVSGKDRPSLWRQITL
jgi:acyl-CoA dehydrogenase